MGLFSRRRETGILDGLSGEATINTTNSDGQRTETQHESEEAEADVATITAELEALSVDDLMHEAFESIAEGDTHYPGSPEAIEYYTRAAAFGQLATAKTLQT